MAMTQKQRVALELLDCGLQMYFDKSYFATIHLAGAAEELFGRYLELSKEAKTAVETIYEGAVVGLGYGLDTVPPQLKKAIYQTILNARNRTKHLHSEGDHNISFDPKREAEVSLHRALANFLEVATRLGIEPTPRMYKFHDEEQSG